MQKLFQGRREKLVLVLLGIVVTLAIGLFQSCSQASTSAKGKVSLKMKLNN